MRVFHVAIDVARIVVPDVHVRIACVACVVLRTNVAILRVSNVDHAQCVEHIVAFVVLHFLFHISHAIVSLLVAMSVVVSIVDDVDATLHDSDAMRIVVRND